ncbi:hypothetical protein [Streptomyces sp. NBC_01462]|uniref:hypothetical protein n=1 Tax=Streptomyces sp. NBC_01462 TaxID=2903876 RepID=UPI002E33C2CE|nr:hypothetical protein [Streptomyces sp. NBC_01462]
MSESRSFRQPQHEAASAATDTLGELRSVCFTLIPHVPAGTSRRVLAQQLADHLSTLTRAGTADRYPVTAEVFVVAEIPGLHVSGQESPCLLVQGWAERPWQRDDEWRHVFQDFLGGVTAWFLEEYPAPAPQDPTYLPVVEKMAEKLVEISDFAAHTSGELPPGWAGQIAWRGPLVSMGPSA